MRGKVAGIIMVVALAVTACEPTDHAEEVAEEFGEGFTAYVGGDFGTALRRFLPLGEQGVREAQYYLGEMYENGKGVTTDIYEAMKWYRRAAQQGDDAAQFSLGFNYANGMNGVEEDTRRGAKWLLLAAEQGNHMAQNELGALHEWGRGVRQNLVAAHMWYNLASIQGSGTRNLDQVTMKMTLAQIGEAQSLAAEWAAEHGKLVCSICS